VIVYLDTSYVQEMKSFVMKRLVEIFRTHQ